MDELMRVVGAKPVEWPAKSRCCGSSLTGTVGDVGLRLNYLILKEAKRRGADVIVTACPFCQFNLECFQNDIARKYDDVAIPVMPFTQLVGMALGISESELGVERLFVRLK
jgi:heterodisulfide reductase subunit B